MEPGTPPRARAGSGDPEPVPPARGDAECEPWVRDKVLFLLHPERWLGAPRPGGAAPPQASRDPPGFPAPAPGGRPLLVRVEDSQVTRRVQRSACAQGRATTWTEERCVAALTFRTHRA